MRYVDTILESSERVTHRAYLHWIVYSRGIVLMLIGGALCRVGEPPAVGVGILLILLAVVALIREAIDRRTTEIAVTNQRVIMKRGLIRRDVIEINMPKVEGVDVRQSILGRLLNYGTVIVRGTGGGLNPLACVSAPLPLRRAVKLAGETSSPNVSRAA